MDEFNEWVLMEFDNGDSLLFAKDSLYLRDVYRHQDGLIKGVQLKDTLEKLGVGYGPEDIHILRIYEDVGTSIQYLPTDWSYLTTSTIHESEIESMVERFGDIVVLPSELPVFEGIYNIMKGCNFDD